MKVQNAWEAFYRKNLQWQAFLETGSEPLLPALRKNLDILKYLGKNIPQASKKLLATGLIIGKMNYLLPLYGGTQDTYLNKLQVILNNTVRFITGAHRRTDTKTLMNSLNWLREMICLHTIIMGWKVTKLNTPLHIATQISTSPDNLLSTSNPRLLNTTLSLRWRICQQWNSLPRDIRDINSLPRFKNRVKTWIRTNRLQVPPDPEQLPVTWCHFTWVYSWETPDTCQLEWTWGLDCWLQDPGVYVTVTYMGRGDTVVYLVLKSRVFLCNRVCQFL